MKRKVIAVALAMSFMLCACQKKNESRKTSKPEETTVTESVSETTEKTSETTTEPTEESSSIPTITEKTGPFEAAPKEKLSYIDCETERKETMVFHSYKDKIGDGFNCLAYYRAWYEEISLDEGKYPALAKAIDDYIAPYWEKMDSTMKQGELDFKADTSGRKQEEDYLHTDVLRADEKVFTVWLHDEPYVTTDKIFNFDVETGSQIVLMDDVVTDKEAFIETVLLKRQEEAHKLRQDISEDAIRDRLQRDQVQFILDYSGVNLLIADIWSEDPVRISYYGHEEMLNGRFFDSIPEEYTIYFNPKEDFEWDLDGDGTTETIRFDVPLNQGDVEDIIVSVGDNKVSFAKDLEDCDGWPFFLMLVHAHGHDFLYATMVGADSVMWQEIFEISKDEITHKGSSDLDMIGKFEEAFRPGKVEGRKENYLVGNVYSAGEYMIGEDGFPVPLGKEFDMGKGYCPCLGIAMEFKRIDPETGEIIGKVTLKPGTSLEPYKSDLERYETFRVLDENSDEDIYVRLEFGANGEFDRMINGRDQDEIFVNLFNGA